MILIIKKRKLSLIFVKTLTCLRCVTACLSQKFLPKPQLRVCVVALGRVLFQWTPINGSLGFGTAPSRVVSLRSDRGQQRAESGILSNTSEQAAVIFRRLMYAVYHFLKRLLRDKLEV